MTDLQMRLDGIALPPLGILTGMGFIGGGAVLRRGDMVTGNDSRNAMARHGSRPVLRRRPARPWARYVGAILWALKWPEVRIRQERRASLMLAIAEDGPTDEEIRSGLESAGYRIASWDATPAFIRSLAERQGVVSLR